MTAAVPPGPDEFVLPPPTFDGLTLGFGRVVVIEWLCPGDRKTGRELVEWMKIEGFDIAVPGRQIELHEAATAADVLAILRTVADETRRGGKWPLIHIEAHGNTEEEPIGYWHRDTAGVETVLTWEELTPALTQINLASHCNLLLVSAACWGHAAILASCESKRIPFIACVGFGTSVLDDSVFEAMKALYVALFDGTRIHLEDAVDAAQATLLKDEDISCDMMQWLSYQTFAGEFRDVLSPDATHTRALNMASQYVAADLTRLSELPYSQALTRLHVDQAHAMQLIWDRRFMIDLYPENRARFGVDIATVIRTLHDQAYRRGATPNDRAPAEDLGAAFQRSPRDAS
jgi:hypothetical protein